ncbi:zinc metallopeptidase [Hominifimenecus sp. rT4P-3]|uniref:zinc metallopeptidase n=1 Tax=Hominifimenecus sp. rT4P-3 TaxID=3242979 RepID=UPI003DA69F93
MFYWWDPTYILVIIAALISMAASARVNSTYSRYAGVRNRSGITGAEAARRILQQQGIYDVSVERISGNLTDHYDPRSKVLRLSDSTFGSSSVAAVGVAAHECGHAIQDAQGYAPLKIRGALVPVANLGATLSWPLVLIGLLIRSDSGMLLIKGGILLFCAVVLFQVVTLPVEFNASSRGMRLLTEAGVLYEDETAQTRKVLSAAAMTYVASVAASLLQLLRLLMIARSRSRD